MATADLKLIYGGGGSFRPTFFSGSLTILSGASGTLLTITPPVGKKVRLVSLSSAVATSEANIQITVDGSIVVGPLNLSSSLPAGAGQFCVGSVSGPSGAINNVSIDYLEGISSIVITKTTGSTSNALSYSFAYGD
jgi:hypothetical protein